MSASPSPSPSKEPTSPSAPTRGVFRAGGAHMENMFIGISGLIGAGKTTLATALGEALGLPVYFEPVIDNEYLADFYRDQQKYSFQLQIYLLNRRFRQHQQIIWSGKGGVQDRTIYEDTVFAKMLMQSGMMEERDYQTYLSLFQNMSNFMKKPTLIVHLDVTPEQSMDRIKMRSRDCESGIPLEYLQKLYQAYDEFITDISQVIPVIKVNYSQFRTAEEMASVIKKEYSRMQNIHEVTFSDKPSASSPSQARRGPLQLTREDAEADQKEAAAEEASSPASSS